MPYGCNYGFSKEWLMERTARRKAYAAKLRGLGIIENSSKWRALMSRKGF